ncbi:ABC transporter substrate-binding protein [Synechocystis sp. PCC 7509]|uniref:ABC transporter substrate-binding protein n=1 Tax=Synechocystis sp. PCC 7509 TaxID=927677 RepID=UPI0002AC36E6|nr:ABC transporter substrate-binding protein [Synechocystis sp. PCC 7509]
MTIKTTAWTRRQTLLLMAGLSGSLALNACQKRSQSTETETTSTKLISANSGSTLWIGYTPLYIALEKGFFQEAGLNLSHKDFSAASDLQAAFGAGRLDAIALATPAAVTLKSKGVDYRVVLVADNSLGGDGILARNSVTDIKDFKGKNVAVEIGEVSHFLLLQVLNNAGLSANDVKITNATPDAAAIAYQAGRTDIAVTYSPFLQKANANQKDGRIIIDTSAMPTAIIDLYLFSNKFIEVNPAGVEGFNKGIFKAIDFMKTNKSEALAITGKRLQISPEEAEAQLKGVGLIDLPTNVKMLSDTKSDIYLLNHLNEVSEFLIEQKQVSQPPDITKILEPKFLKA